MPPNPFKRALRAGRPQLGLWSSLASHVSVEILAGAGFDWLLLDTEHSANEPPMVHAQLMAAAGSPTHCVVRPAWNDTVLIKRLLDMGVQSLLVPFVQDAAEAERAVAATRYPPQGVRGFASQSRASRWGRVDRYFERAAEEICVLVQVETRHALGNLEAIAAVEGVDGVFVGPGDLSADMGLLGQPGHPDVVDAVEDAIRRIAACGKAPGVLTGDEAIARRCMAAGCLFTAVGADVGLLARGAEQLAARLRRPAPDRPG